MHNQKDIIGKVLGQIPSGLFVLTYYNQEINKPDGILMSWIQQISFHPPMVMIAVNKERKALKSLEKNGKFALNILHSDNKELMKQFGRNGIEALESNAVQYTLNGDKAAILSDSLSTLELSKVDLFSNERADHHIMMAEVIGAHTQSNFENNSPIIHLRKSGFHY